MSMNENYEDMSVVALRAMAKEMGLRHISALKKSDLVEVIRAAAQKEESSNGKTAKENESSEQNAQQARRMQQPQQSERENRTPARREYQPERGREQRQPMRRESQSERMQRSEQYQNQERPERTQRSEQRQNPERLERMQRSEQRQNQERPERTQHSEQYQNPDRPPMELASLDSGESATGVLEVLPDGYGFLRTNHYLSGENDVYVAPSQIRRFNLRTGDVVTGNTRINAQTEKFRALLYIQSVNGLKPSDASRRKLFEHMTPIFPDHRIRLERTEKEMAMRIVDLISPVGRGQRGMIVSPPKAGKTTLLKDVAKSILRNEPDMHLMIMLIDERPEEVTDIREAIVGDNVEVLHSTFDELPEHHIKVAEMGIERAKRMVECGMHVTILLDSITRLARAYNMTISPSGRTLSGGLDPAALNMPKRFFGAARNMREGGSLTILATALVDTGSKMDDVVYEEFKGTGNMELVLDRKLSERRVFPAIDIQKSGTRREDLLLESGELEAVFIMRKALNGQKSEDAVENILNTFARTKNNGELVERIRRQKFV